MKFEVSSACSQKDIDLLLQASDLARDIPGDIIELGSYKGASAMALAGRNTHKLVYACDLFGGNPYPERKTFDYLSDVNFAEVLKSIVMFPNIRVIRGMHEDTIPLLPIDKVSFLFLDSDWYESHIVGLKYLAPKIPVGGIVAFHDWRFGEVQQAAIESLAQEEWEFIEGQFEYVQDKQGMAFIRRINAVHL